MYLDNRKYFYYQYDLDATTYKYGRLGGPTGLPCVKPDRYGAKTSGSSTTVTSAAGTPFDPVNVGDFLIFSIPPDTKLLRKVATKTSGAQITVDSAIDLGTVGVPFDHWPFRIGATANDGWHQVQMYTSITVHIYIPTVAAAGGVDVQIETNSGDPATPTVPYTQNFASATTETVNVAEVASALRVGVKGGSGFAGTDSITIWLQGEMRSR
jgi:hypothetical protein